MNQTKPDLWSSFCFHGPKSKDNFWNSWRWKLCLCDVFVSISLKSFVFVSDFIILVSSRDPWTSFFSPNSSWWWFNARYRQLSFETFSETRFHQSWSMILSAGLCLNVPAEAFLCIFLAWTHRSAFSCSFTRMKQHKSDGCVPETPWETFRLTETNVPSLKPGNRTREGMGTFLKNSRFPEGDGLRWGSEVKH